MKIFFQKQKQKIKQSKKQQQNVKNQQTHERNQLLKTNQKHIFEQTFFCKNQTNQKMKKSKNTFIHIYKFEMKLWALKVAPRPSGVLVVKFIALCCVCCSVVLFSHQGCSVQQWGEGGDGRLVQASLSDASRLECVFFFVQMLPCGKGEACTASGATSPL